MYSNVGIQHILHVEPLLAVRAFVRPVTSVHPSVANQIILLAVCIPAYGTQVWLLPGVRQLVVLQLNLLSETAPASLTLKRTDI